MNGLYVLLARKAIHKTRSRTSTTPLTAERDDEDFIFENTQTFLHHGNENKTAAKNTSQNFASILNQLNGKAVI